jgi:hypothetical protein
MKSSADNGELACQGTRKHAEMVLLIAGHGCRYVPVEDGLGVCLAIHLFIVRGILFFLRIRGVHFWGTYL